MSVSEAVRRPILSFAFPGPPNAAEENRVEDRVDRDDRAREDELRLRRQVLGIDDAKQITLDEIAPVCRASRELSKPILQGGQRADPPPGLDEDSPGRRRKVDPGEPRPAEHEQAARENEDDEEEMEDDGEVGEERVEESQASIRRRSCGRGER